MNVAPPNRIALSLSVLLLAGSAWAQGEMGNSLTIDLLRALLALAFVLALFFLLVFLLRRYYPKLIQKLPDAAGKSEQIEVRSVRSLGPKRFLYLVRVNNKHYLLGGTDQVISKIDEWDDSTTDESGSSSSSTHSS